MLDYDGNILDQETVVSARAELENQLNINFSWDNSHRASFEGYTFKDIRDYNFGVSYSPSEKFWMRFGYDWGDRIARNITVPELGDRKIIPLILVFSLQINFDCNTDTEKTNLLINCLEKIIFLVI